MAEAKAEVKAGANNITPEKRQELIGLLDASINGETPVSPAVYDELLAYPEIKELGELVEQNQSGEILPADVRPAKVIDSRARPYPANPPPTDPNNTNAITLTRYAQNMAAVMAKFLQEHKLEQNSSSGAKKAIIAAQKVLKIALKAMTMEDLMADISFGELLKMKSPFYGQPLIKERASRALEIKDEIKAESKTIGRERQETIGGVTIETPIPHDDPDTTHREFVRHYLSALKWNEYVVSPSELIQNGVYFKIPFTQIKQRITGGLAEKRPFVRGAIAQLEEELKNQRRENFAPERPEPEQKREIQLPLSEVKTPEIVAPVPADKTAKTPAAPEVPPDEEGGNLVRNWSFVDSDATETPKKPPKSRWHWLAWAVATSCIAIAFLCATGIIPDFATIGAFGNTMVFGSVAFLSGLASILFGAEKKQWKTFYALAWLTITACIVLSFASATGIFMTTLGPLTGVIVFSTAAFAAGLISIASLTNWKNWNTNRFTVYAWAWMLITACFALAFASATGIFIPTILSPLAGTILFGATALVAGLVSLFSIPSWKNSDQRPVLYAFAWLAIVTCMTVASLSMTGPLIAKHLLSVVVTVGSFNPIGAIVAGAIAVIGALVFASFAIRNNNRKMREVDDDPSSSLQGPLTSSFSMATKQLKKMIHDDPASPSKTDQQSEISKIMESIKEKLGNNTKWKDIPEESQTGALEIIEDALTMFKDPLLITMTTEKIAHIIVEKVNNALHEGGLTTGPDIYLEGYEMGRVARRLVGWADYGAETLSVNSLVDAILTHDENATPQVEFPDQDEEDDDEEEHLDNAPRR